LIKFSIIIVTWNALDHLKTYLPSVAQTRYPHFEIIIADNHSQDGSVEWVRKQFPEIQIEKLNKNYGYCGGNNRGAKAAGGEVLIFLNNDVRVDADWLNPLSTVFEQHKDVAVVQPKIRSDREPHKFEYAGAAGGYLDRYGYPYCRGRLFNEIETDQGQYDNDVEISWASGAAMAVRRDHFRHLDGFDEDFEFHMEEIDFCWRTWRACKKVRYCHKSIVYHLGGGSLPMGHPRKVYYNFRNSLYMLYKNLDQPICLRRLTARLLLDGIAFLQALLKMQVYDAQAIIKAHFHFWKNLKQLEIKRTSLMENFVDKASYAMPLKNIFLVAEFFLKRNKSYSELPKD